MLNKILVWLGVKRDAKVEVEAFTSLAGGPVVRASDLNDFADSVFALAEDAATRLDEACRNAKPKRTPRKKAAAKKTTAKRKSTRKTTPRKATAKKKA